MAAEIFYGLGTLAVGGALAWAMTHNKRSAASNRLTEEATRAEYEHPNSYNQKREELKRKYNVGPNGQPHAR